MSERLRTVAIVGDGVAGWSAASALVTRVPGLAVAVVPAGTPGDVVDRLALSTPATIDFHRDVGIDAEGLAARAGARPRAGTLFRGWNAHDHVHAYGPVGTPLAGVPFAALWPRAPEPSIEAYSPAAALARAGRRPDGNPLFDGVAHGLSIDPVAYRDYLVAWARRRGARRTAAPLAGASVSEGRVTALQLADGGSLTADAYVDASGVAARLLSQLPGGSAWQDWRGWLPCDRLDWVKERGVPGLLDVATAQPDGWRLEGQVTVRHGGDGTPLAQGRRAAAWHGNVVAVGEAYAALEPLEAAPLHLLHTQLDRLVASLPGRDIAAAECAAYDRESGEEADRLRDFLILRYAIADRPKPFWQARRATPLPPELAETLALFRHRGRLPVRDGEGFARDSWRQVLFGAGVLPAVADGLALAADLDQVRAGMFAYRRQLAAAVERAPRA